jgi:ubiquinone/menaquinone biosynthesis C-methylase UbiE
MFKKIMSYNPKQYWMTRENPNAREGEAEDRVQTDIAFIRQAAAEANKVLEVGPGVGRTLDAYQSGQRVTTLDLSTNYQGKIAAKAEELDLQISQNFLDSAENAYPFRDNEFDLAVSCQVFMHLPPQVMDQAIREFSRMADKLVIIAGFFSTFPDQATAAFKANHVFSHDYVALLQGVGFDVARIESRYGRIYIMADRAVVERGSRE